jgi:hypothetical protein
VRRLVAAGALAALAACAGARDTPSLRVVDLVEQLPHAVTQPRDTRFSPTLVEADGALQPAIAVPASSRMTWTFDRLPRRGILSATAVAAGSTPATVAFRVGISDGRIYETLLDQAVTTAPGAPRTLRVDLGGYAGPQWSLFYRPDGRRWAIILATTVVEGMPEGVYWVAPGLETDRDAARRYHAERAGR